MGEHEERGHSGGRALCKGALWWVCLMQDGTQMVEPDVRGHYDGGA